MRRVVSFALFMLRLMGGFCGYIMWRIVRNLGKFTYTVRFRRTRKSIDLGIKIVFVLSEVVL